MSDDIVDLSKGCPLCVKAVEEETELLKRLQMSRERVAQITNDIAEDIHTARKSELEKCVAYWALMHHYARAHAQNEQMAQMIRKLDAFISKIER